MLQDVDILVFDIQDVGARFYTYISTMGNIMEAGAENGIPVIILDRPNPWEDGWRALFWIYNGNPLWECTPFRFVMDSQWVSWLK